MRVHLRALPFLFVVSALGCSSAPPERRGSSLTQAAEEAKKDENDKKKVLATTPEEEREATTAETAGAVGASLVASDAGSDSAAAPPATLEPEEDDMHIIVSLLGGGGTLKTEDFDGFGAFGLGFGVDEKRMRADLWFFYMPTNLTEQSGVVEALVDEREWAVDARFRYSFTPEYTFAGIYGLIGARLGMLQWTYQNGVVVNDENGNPQTIDDDRLTYYAGYLGIGIAPVQTPHFVLSVDVAGGLKTFKGYTNEGFKQDLFDDPVGFGQVMFSAGWRF